MSGNIRRILVLTLAAGLMWHCGGERVTQSQTETAGPPLGKLAARGHASQAAAEGQSLARWRGRKRCEGGIFALHCRPGNVLPVVWNDR